ncbi:hypothetical protein [Microcoleus sp. D2_18a_B4]|uniref:hypothetical protein n=1 Tax=Microcoleus sp. D2_18a_B4 TaxID=3055329 RepID=UPI002FD459FC
MSDSADMLVQESKQIEPPETFSVSDLAGKILLLAAAVISADRGAIARKYENLITSSKISK